MCNGQWSVILPVAPLHVVIPSSVLFNQSLNKRHNVQWTVRRQFDVSVIMTACEACHSAKVRCQQQTQSSIDRKGPCKRCQARGIECIPRISRQGQGKKPRRRKQKQELRQEDSTNKRARSSKEEVSDIGEANDEHHRPSKPSEDRGLVQQLSGSSNHFGILYMIHSWISFAFTRNSFGLLSRASKLAEKCGVTLNVVFNSERQYILTPIIFPSSSPTVNDKDDVWNNERMKWSDIPEQLMQVCNVQSNAIATTTSNDGSSGNRDERYILVREVKYGQSRYLTSEAFERDICCLQDIKKCWKDNAKPVVKLFMTRQEDFVKFTKAIHMQIARYVTPTTQPIQSRVAGLQIKMKRKSHTGDDANETSSEQTRTMNLLHCYELLSLEHSFYLSEYYIPDRNYTSLSKLSSEESTSTGTTHDESCSTKGSSQEI